jgi:hypothetical protein
MAKEPDIRWSPVAYSPSSRKNRRPKTPSAEPSWSLEVQAATIPSSAAGISVGQSTGSQYDHQAKRHCDKRNSAPIGQIARSQDVFPQSTADNRPA